MMKRSSSEAISSDQVTGASDAEAQAQAESGPDSEDQKPVVGSPGKAKRVPRNEVTPKKRKPSDGSSEGGQINGEWTPEKKGRFMDTIIATGYKACNLDELGGELGMNKRQLINQLAPGRKGSLRDKAVQAVKADK